MHTCTRAEGADGLGFWVRKGGKTGEYSNKVIGIGFPASFVDFLERGKILHVLSLPLLFSQ